MHTKMNMGVKIQPWWNKNSDTDKQRNVAVISYEIKNKWNAYLFCKSSLWKNNVHYNNFSLAYITSDWIIFYTKLFFSMFPTKASKLKSFKGKLVAFLTLQIICYPTAKECRGTCTFCFIIF